MQHILKAKPRCGATLLHHLQIDRTVDYGAVQPRPEDALLRVDKQGLLANNEMHGHCCRAVGVGVMNG